MGMSGQNSARSSTFVAVPGKTSAADGTNAARHDKHMTLIHKALMGLFVRRARRRAGLTRRRCTLPSGETYVYLEGGKGPPLLLLHGFGANKDNFNGVAAALTRRWRVIVPDHFGFGESDRPLEGDYSPPAQARRLRAFAATLGIGRLDLGGSSMGGHIAMTYAALFPDDVRSLWLLDTAGVWSAPKGEMHRHAAATGENLLLASSVAEFERLFAFVMHRPPRVPRAVMRVLAEQRMANLAVERRIFAQCAADSVEARVRGLPVPTCVVWGREDRVIPVETVDVLQGLLPLMEHIVLPEVGHLPMVEAPQRCIDDYLAFQERLAARAGERRAEAATSALA